MRGFFLRMSLICLFFFLLLLFDQFSFKEVRNGCNAIRNLTLRVAFLSLSLTLTQHSIQMDSISFIQFERYTSSCLLCVCVCVCTMCMCRWAIMYRLLLIWNNFSFDHSVWHWTVWCFFSVVVHMFIRRSFSAWFPCHSTCIAVVRQQYFVVCGLFSLLVLIIWTAYASSHHVTCT